MARGCEGTVIRNGSAKYLHNTRTTEMMKYKKTLDAEYLIIGMTLDKNNHPVFTCISDEVEFKVKPKGTAEEREEIVRTFEEVYNNKWYKIEYETLSKAGIPLKPIGIGLRDCSEDGTPLT